MLEDLSKSVLLFLIASILVELRPTKKMGQNVLGRGSIHISIIYYLLSTTSITLLLTYIVKCKVVHHHSLRSSKSYSYSYSYLPTLTLTLTYSYSYLLLLLLTLVLVLTHSLTYSYSLIHPSPSISIIGWLVGWLVGWWVGFLVTQYRRQCFVL